MEQNNNARNVRPPTPPPSPPPQIQGPDVIAWVPWSLFSPYQTKTSSKPHVPDKIPELHGWKEAPLYDPTYYEGPSQGQHFPTGKLKISDQARRELENLFHEQAAEKMRNHWDRWEIYWQIWSHQMPVAAGYIAPNSGQHYIPPELYLNKHQEDGCRGTSPHGSADIFWKFWFNMHGGRPPLQRYNGLATPTRIWDCPWLEVQDDMKYTVEHHSAMCSRLANLEQRVANIYRIRSERSTLQGRVNGEYEEYLERYAPDPGEGRHTYRQLGLQMGHLYRSIFMIVDCWKYPPDPPDPDEWKSRDFRPLLDIQTTTHEAIKGREPFTMANETPAEEWREWWTARQTVLLVLTEGNKQLSAPISFQPLFDAGRVLPLDREDLCFASCSPRSRTWEWLVRVRLDHALEFIHDLIRREEDALDHVRYRSEALRRELDDMCGSWIASVVKHAQQVGPDNDINVWKATRRARARESGQAFDVKQVVPDWMFLQRPGYGSR
ncbi:hypothetical protein VTJ04DRAFT_5226 [Mycothermus thermophilus]|uniref:uncharacterized protein n=1 Tax=Humicola insolens TaxID=85995 RepID=UPI003744305F